MLQDLVSVVLQALRLHNRTLKVVYASKTRLSDSKLSDLKYASNP